MADDSIQHNISKGDNPPANDLLQLNSGSIPILGLTVSNYTSMSISVYVGQSTTNGEPSFSVLPYQEKALPIPSAKQVSLGYSGQNNADGQIYIHYMDSPVAALSTPLPPVVQGSRYFNAYWDGARKLVNGNSGDIVQCNGIGIHGSDTTHIFPGETLYVTDIRLDGLDLQRLLWYMTYNIPSKFGNFLSIGLSVRGNIDRTFAPPGLPAFMNGYGGPVTFTFGITTNEAYVPTITPYGFMNGYIQ